MTKECTVFIFILTLLESTILESTILVPVEKCTILCKMGSV